MSLSILTTPLAARLSKEFSAAEFSKGRSYYGSGAVKLARTELPIIRARVSGSASQPYKVELDFSEAAKFKEINGFCSCPRFDELGECKHITAVILKLDSIGFHQQIPGSARLRFLDSEDEFDDESDADSADESDDAPPTNKLLSDLASSIPIDVDYLSQLSPADARAYVSALLEGSPLKDRLLPVARSNKSNAKAKLKKQPPPESAWKRQLAALRQLQASQQPLDQSPALQPRSRRTRRFMYALDLSRVGQSRGFEVSIFCQDQLKNGEWGKLKAYPEYAASLFAEVRGEDAELVAMMCGNRVNDAYGYTSSNAYFYQKIQSCLIDEVYWKILIPKLCATGRFGVIIPGKSPQDAPSFTPLRWDDGPPYTFSSAWEFNSKAKTWIFGGALGRGGPDQPERLTVHEPKLVFVDGLLILADRIALLEPLRPAQRSLLTALRQKTALQVPARELDQFLPAFLALPGMAEEPLPPEFGWLSAAVAPLAKAIISRPENTYVHSRNLLGLDIEFDYNGQRIRYGDPKPALINPAEKQVIPRDQRLEAEWLEKLPARDIAINKNTYGLKTRWQLPVTKLSAVVEALTRAGWNVEAEGKLFRQAGSFQLSVASGLDWFDLDAKCDFEGVSASLPALLAAVKKGQSYVELDDGTRGMLPQKWLDKFAPLAEMATIEGESLRFQTSQALLLDALLAAQPGADADETFARIRQKIQSFDGVDPAQEPVTFQGTLREYQRIGLGWLLFLQEIGCGGCLADDMGLGKTIQVLALLERLRCARLENPPATGAAKLDQTVIEALPAPQTSKTKSNGKTTAIKQLKTGDYDPFASTGTNGDTSGDAREPLPTLVVAPKSLIFNWIDETNRFAPNLRVLNYTGLERRGAHEQFDQFDLIVTTYGTLRQDIGELTKQRFRYVILDEAQAIKNADSQSAKAARLLKARHRLAMTGTPVENQLGDLWSIFEFLNPGMLGRSNQARLFSGKGLSDKTSVELLARALRPYLLRRTKEQVLTELPAKTEQTLYCELEPKQRKLYDELRDYYRDLLNNKIAKSGLKQSKIQVLEALLRLRQAACHPALLDKSNAKLPSAKFDALLEQLEELRSEGHKALVFSQFTSLLALLRRELDQRGYTYEYLDGKTTKRGEVVKRFQEDAKCGLFLISLKAGGHGLNLTAADYVFILDPWWNPAVEAQAVDRAHRMGQTKPVFAYRLIARDTVEEKILTLQAQKKQLAEAIISADENLLRTLTAEDLQLLLS